MFVLTPSICATKWQQLTDLPSVISSHDTLYLPWNQSLVLLNSFTAVPRVYSLQHNQWVIGLPRLPFASRSFAATAALSSTQSM
jgi:hypothetical protein